MFALTVDKTTLAKGEALQFQSDAKPTTKSAFFIGQKLDSQGSWIVLQELLHNMNGLHWEFVVGQFGLDSRHDHLVTLRIYAEDFTGIPSWADQYDSSISFLVKASQE